MRKLIVVLISCMFLMGVHAQKADMRVSELVNSSNWFVLEKEYPLLKDSIQYEFVGLMAEAMIAQHFNREKESIELFRTLINSHQQEIGSNAALNLAIMAIGNYEHCGMYALAAEKAFGVIEQIRSSGAPFDYTNLNEIYERNKALSKYDATIVLRHNRENVIIPFTMENTDTSLFDNHKPVSNRYYIPVTIHGTTYQFMFDTGSTTTYLSKRFADLVGVEYVGYGSQYGNLAYVDSLQLGDITFKNVITMVHDGIPTDSVCTIDAVLGMDILRQLDELQIDNKKNWIIIPAKQSRMPEYGRNLVCANKFFFVEAKDVKGALTVFLDSGAETGFTYNYFVKHQNELSQLRGVKEITTGGVNGFHSTMAIQVPSIKFVVCGHELGMENVYVPYMKGAGHNGNDVILGVDFFRQYDKVTLNFKEMFMAVE